MKASDGRAWLVLGLECVPNYVVSHFAKDACDGDEHIALVMSGGAASEPVAKQAPLVGEQVALGAYPVNFERRGAERFAAFVGAAVREAVDGSRKTWQTETRNLAGGLALMRIPERAVRDREKQDDAQGDVGPLDFIDGIGVWLVEKPLKFWNIFRFEKHRVALRLPVRVGIDCCYWEVLRM
jgi:hypothetical protein